MLDKDSPLSPELSRFLVFSDWQWLQQEQTRAQAAVAEFLAHQRESLTDHA